MKLKAFFIIFLGFFLGLMLKFFVIDMLVVSGKSMIPYLKEGDFIFVNKLSYGLNVPFQSKFFIQWKTPKENDVVIFLHDNKFVVKRCVAVEDTHLDFLYNNGYNLMLGEKTIPLTKNQFSKLCEFEKVPKDFVFLLGDNLEESIDSRDYGFVSVKNITGKIIGK